MTNKNVLKVAGIQCDNEPCDYTNTNIDPQDYESWINTTCPKCGSILFTEDDFNLYKLLSATIAIANKLPTGQATLPTDIGKIYNPQIKSSK